MNPKDLGEERTGCAVMRNMKVEYERNIHERSIFLFMQLHEIGNVTHLSAQEPHVTFKLDFLLRPIGRRLQQIG